MSGQIGWSNLSAIGPSKNSEGLTLRQAALIAGFGYLIMPVAYAEYSIYPKLVIPHNIDQTAQNIAAHGRLFAVAILCYLITFILDIVIAWALYILLAPVNRSLSLLTAWFGVVYAAVALVATMNLATVFRLLHTPDYLSVFGAQPLHAQVKLLLDSFQYQWSMSLVIFAVHLVLLGYLVFRSGYIPRVIGVALLIDGLAWVIDCLRPYFYSSIHLHFISVAFFGELVFMVWLLIRGWKIQEPAARS